MKNLQLTGIYLDNIEPVGISDDFDVDLEVEIFASDDSDTGDAELDDECSETNDEDEDDDEIDEDNDDNEEDDLVSEEEDED